MLYPVPYFEAAAYDDPASADMIDNCYNLQNESVAAAKQQALRLVKELEAPIRTLATALTAAPSHILSTDEVRELLKPLGFSCREGP